MARQHHNELAALAADIRLAHEAARRSALETAEHVMQAGHKLIEAKAMLPHGSWSTWLREHCDLSERTARRYMQVARSGLETATVADFGPDRRTLAAGRRRLDCTDVRDVSRSPALGRC